LDSLNCKKPNQKQELDHPKKNGKIHLHW
jgi:hypothetical protein